MRKYIILPFLSLCLLANFGFAQDCDRLLRVARSNYASLIPILFNAEEMHHCNAFYPWGPLHEAAYYGAYESAARLIALFQANGFAIDDGDGNGYTPMGIALVRGHPGIVGLLRASGARR